MLSRVLRVLLAFVAACLVAALVQLMFVRSPLGLAGFDPQELLAGLPELALLTLAIATYLGTFAAPFALVAAVFGEWLRLRGLLYYMLSGLLIAGFGLFAQFNGEGSSGPSILNSYAALAFASAGMAGGWMYWLLAGRRAGGFDLPVNEALPGPPPIKVRPAVAEEDVFSIERRAGTNPTNRLVAPSRLHRADFQGVADRLGTKPVKARKIGLVAARKADETETVVTEWNGSETSNTALPGDWIVTNMSRDKVVLTDAAGHANTYVIKAETFPGLYEPVPGENEHGSFFKAKGTVEAIFLSGGFDLVAPWGERQQAERGYLVMNGKDVYGNNAETFEATYETLSER